MLKRLFTYNFGFLLILSLVLGSCVNDDSFFPDEPANDIKQSTAIVTTLNEFRSIEPTFPEEQLCFRFVYPIYLGYNNDSNIRIDSFEGLLSAIGSQSSNFNITGLQFPFDVIINNNVDTPITITNEQSFVNLLRECDIATLRDDFDRFFNRCFKLDFPVTLLVNNQEFVINNLEEFENFYTNQSVDYQPQFKFPVNVLVAPDFSTVSIDTYYGFYRILDSCDRCPELSFTFDLVEPSNLGYRFIADFPDLDRVGSYSWIVNDEFIENDGPDNNGDNQLLFDFDTPGIYKVCIVTETPDCPQGIEYCKEIVVEAFCPDLFFEFEQEPGTLGYSFFANFEGINEITYEWTIDGQVIETDGGAGANNTLFSELTPGEHIVCIKTETRTCPEGTEFCREILVEPICPDLFFIVEQEGDTPSYNFMADFVGIDQITYSWTIDGDVIESDGGANGDNMFFFQFSPGTYQICIIAETDTCPEGTEFCTELVVQ